jgi:FG-GAP-like repeat
VTVTAPAGCMWSVTSNASWIAPGFVSTSGSADLPYTVANDVNVVPLAIPRTGTMTIAGQTFTVNQEGLAQVSVPAPGSALSGTSVEFSWTPVTGADSYRLSIGHAEGAADIFTDTVSSTTDEVDDLPCDGLTVYVRLQTHINGYWQSSQDYTYWAWSGCGVAHLATPAEGALLNGTTVTFSWRPVEGADSFRLDVGTATGLSDIGSATTSTDAVTIQGLPCNGGIFYVRLTTHRDGAWQDPLDYSYNASLVCGDIPVQLASPLIASAGRAPTKIQVADFNGDGRPDAAVLTSDGVSVLLGKGDGTFNPSNTVTVVYNVLFPVATRDFAIGDVNGDGKPDLIVQGTYTGNLSPQAQYVIVVLPGNGDGTFGAPIFTAVDQYTFLLAAADVNGDGLSDAIVVNNSTLLTFLSKGDGTFGNPVTSSLPVNSVDTCSPGDFNGDGHVDLLLGIENGGYVLVLTGDGNGKFYGAAQISVPGLTRAIAADVNGDRNLDIVTIETAMDQGSVMLGDGHGGFGPAKTFSAGVPIAYPTAVAAGDFNGDRRMDLAIAQSPDVSTSTIDVALGNGDGTFQAPFHAAEMSFPADIAAIDTNNDHKVDLLALSNTSLETFLNIGAGVVGPIRGDLDGNGTPDLFWQNDSTREVGVWYLGGPEATTVLGLGYPAPGSYPGWRLVTIADMDGNGVPDLIWQNDNTRQVGVWYMGGAQGMTVLGLGYPAPGSYPGWRLAAVADMDGNGVPDLVWQNDTTRAVGTWYMGGPQGTTVLRVAYQAPGSYPGWTLVAVADMNRDGVPDLIWQNDNTRQVGTWYMSGPQALTSIGVAYQAPGSYPGWKVVGVVDMDGNGVPDLIWQNDTTRQVGTWYMAGAQGTTLLDIAYQAPGSYPGWRAVGPR